MANIWIAASDNNIDTVKEYISSGKCTANDKDPNGYTPIHAAASYGHLELLDYLMSQGGNINITDEEGDTPLHVVEDASVAKVIVEQYNGNVRIQNNDGQTALERLEEEDEFPEAIEYLRGIAGLGDDESRDNSTPLRPLPENSSLRYTYEEQAESIDPEQRRRLEQIVHSENPEEELRQLVREALHIQVNGEEHPKKYRKDVD
jgi:uncharacterized protein